MFVMNHLKAVCVASFAVLSGFAPAQLKWTRPLSQPNGAFETNTQPKSHGKSGRAFVIPNGTAIVIEFSELNILSTSYVLRVGDQTRTIPRMRYPELILDQTPSPKKPDLSKEPGFEANSPLLGLHKKVDDDVKRIEDLWANVASFRNLLKELRDAGSPQAISQAIGSLLEPEQSANASAGSPATMSLSVALELFEARVKSIPNNVNEAATAAQALRTEAVSQKGEVLSIAMMTYFDRLDAYLKEMASKIGDAHDRLLSAATELRRESTVREFVRMGRKKIDIYLITDSGTTEADIKAPQLTLVPHAPTWFAMAGPTVDLLPQARFSGAPGGTPSETLRFGTLGLGLFAVHPLFSYPSSKPPLGLVLGLALPAQGTLRFCAGLTWLLGDRASMGFLAGISFASARRVGFGLVSPGGAIPTRSSIAAGLILGFIARL